jgi:hypothetical protein
MPPNTLTIELQPCPFHSHVICLDSIGAESTGDPDWDIEATSRISSIADESIDTDIKTEVIHLQTLDKYHPQLETWHALYNIEYHPGGLWWKDHALVIMGNDDLKRGVLHLFHNSATTGHPRIVKTISTITPYYWWPGMCDFITEYIKGCAMYQMNEVNTHPMKPPLYPITLVQDTLPFQTITLNFIVKFPKSSGYDTVLTVTDHNCS